MLREIRTRQGRARFVPLIRMLARLKLTSEDTAQFVILAVVFSELTTRNKDE